MKKYLFILMFVLVLPMTVSAVTLHLLDASSTVRVGDTFAVAVDLDTGSDSINAIDGVLNFSPTLALQTIRLTGSLVPLWVTQPKATSNTTIAFAGVLPGGYQGAGAISPDGSIMGNVFTLILKAQQEGTAHISFDSQTSVYRNDGNGTPASLVTKSLDIKIVPAEGTPTTVLVPKDTTAPESFTPRVVSGSSFGSAGDVLVFATEDKDSGVSEYDIARSIWGNAPQVTLSWEPVSSPYQLTSSDESEYVYIRAVDAFGNSKVAIVAPQKMGLSRIVNAWWTYIGIAILLMLVVLRYRRRK